MGRRVTRIDAWVNGYTDCMSITKNSIRGILLGVVPFLLYVNGVSKVIQNGVLFLFDRTLRHELLDFTTAEIIHSIIPPNVWAAFSAASAPHPRGGLNVEVKPFPLAVRFKVRAKAATASSSFRKMRLFKFQVPKDG